MSSNTKTTSRGGKGSKGDSGKSHKQDKGDTGKTSNDKSQHIGGGESAKSQKNTETDVKEKVRQIIEMTQRSEEEVCFALQQCDNDAQEAVNMLFEQSTVGEWETTCKKKKNRQASASKGEGQDAGGAGEWSENQAQSGDKDKSRNKSGGPPRLHGRNNDSRGWKGRENKENERNLDDGGQSDRRERRGRPGGPTRGGGGRGRGGGRAGGRYPPRGGNRNNNFNTRTIDTWDNATTWDNSTVTFSSSQVNDRETWDDFPTADDWSTEEYTGSLADTKVFTPSTQQQVEPDIGTETSTNLESDGSMVLAESSTLNSAAQQLSHAMDMHNQMPPQGSNPIASMSPTSMVGGPLNAAQTQYLSQFTQQGSDAMKSVQYGNATPQSQYNSGQVYVNNSTAGSQPYSAAQPYGNTPAQNSYAAGNYSVVNSNYRGTTEQGGQAQQPTRTKTQRARVPPPSKIPASAVEMPGDLNSSIGFLDVQFGAMDFMSDGNTFENDNKYGSQNEATSNTTPSSNLDLNQTNQNVSSIDSYSAAKQSTQGSISSALSQNLSNTDTIPQQTSEHLTNTYNTASRSSAPVTNATPSVTAAGMEINKQTDSHSYAPSSTYNSYQPKTSTAYQAQSYSSSGYNATQTTTSSYTANQSNSNYASSNTGSYNPPSAGTHYQNAYSSNSYQSSTNSSGFPSISQANTYPPPAVGNQSYQHNTSQSVYGSNTGLNSSSGFGNTSSSSNQYSTYNSSSNKLKDSTYDTSATTATSSVTNTSSVSTTTASLSLSQTTATGTKTAATLAKNTSSVMSNIPPGVAPVMSTQYIMSQGIPYFQQPIYSFEEMQLLQQRIPHMTTGYYDMSYQTPTTLAAVRDGTLANVAYSISDGRFTRGDNTSPVPSTLSQQTNTLTQGHQAQPMLAQTGPAPFFYTAAAYNPMQPTYQFGAVYPQQLPTVTNAHGSNNTNQYPKPATYGSGYGSGYDALTQSQDYTKGGYMGNTQGQNKGAGANSSSTGSTGNDLTAVYGKSHTALGKVNSYEKQGFHSGTPPPFTGALHGSQNAGLAPSGTGYGPQVYIPTIAPHQQHHSTPLIHQPLHQMEVRHQNRRLDSGNTTGQRSQAANQGKSGSKQYPTSYWNQA